MFNDPKTTKDNYPRGIKGEPKLSALLSKIKAKKISYIFGEVNKGNLSEFIYIFTNQYLKQTFLLFI